MHEAKGKGCLRKNVHAGGGKNVKGLVSEDRCIPEPGGQQQTNREGNGPGLSSMCGCVDPCSLTEIIHCNV
jgi:hypothetical protein